MHTSSRSKMAEMFEQFKNKRRKATKAVEKFVKRIVFCLLIWKKRKEKWGRIVHK